MFDPLIRTRLIRLRLVALCASHHSAAEWCHYGVVVLHLWKNGCSRTESHLVWLVFHLKVEPVPNKNDFQFLFSLFNLKEDVLP